MTQPLVVDLGFDLGTTVTKLTALAEDGTKLLDLSVATTWDELGDGCAERDPRAVVAAVEDLLARTAATVGTTNGHGPLEVRSIGFASMAESGVLVDADGEPRSPVIAWFDPRGRDQLAAARPSWRTTSRPAPACRSPTSHRYSRSPGCATKDSRSPAPSGSPCPSS